MALPELGGIEPDYCFISGKIGTIATVGIDLPPDLVIEIDVTYTDANDYLLGCRRSGCLKKNQLTIHVLRESEYYLQDASRYFPDIDLEAIVTSCLQAAKKWQCSHSRIAPTVV